MTEPSIADTELPEGKVTLKTEFTPDGSKEGGGILKLFVNGKPAGEGKLNVKQSWVRRARGEGVPYLDGSSPLARIPRISATSRSTSYSRISMATSSPSSRRNCQRMPVVTVPRIVVTPVCARY